MEKLMQFYFNLPQESLNLALGIAERVTRTFGSEQDKEKSWFELWSSIYNDIFKFFFKPVELLAESQYQKGSPQEESESLFKAWFKMPRDYYAKALEVNNKVMESYLQTVKTWQEYNLNFYERWFSALKASQEEIKEAISVIEGEKENKNPLA